MGRPFKRQKVSRALPAAVQVALTEQFELPPRVVSQLGYIEKAGRFAGRPVRYICIFDRTLVPEGGRAIRTWDDVMAHREALLFEGHIERDGSVKLLDRRPLKPGETTPPPGP